MVQRPKYVVLHTLIPRETITSNTINLSPLSFCSCIGCSASSKRRSPMPTKQPRLHPSEPKRLGPKRRSIQCWPRHLSEHEGVLRLIWMLSKVACHHNDDDSNKTSCIVFLFFVFVFVDEIPGDSLLVCTIVLLLAYLFFMMMMLNCSLFFCESGRCMPLSSRFV